MEIILDSSSFLNVIFGGFIAVLFLQSGLDKVLDRKGNLEWLSGHFAQSPLRNFVPILLTAISLMEILSGVLASWGLLAYLIHGDLTFIRYAMHLSALTLLFLFTGQRLAKDYAGAVSLINYAIFIVLGIYIMR